MTDTTTTIRITTDVNASIEKVWDFYTNPQHITQWNFASADWCCPRASSDLRTGGVFSSRMESRDGKYGFDFEGVYDEVVDKKSIKYTFGGRRAQVIFEDLADHVTVTVEFEPEHENSLQMQRDGWQSILNNFKSYVETGKAHTLP